MNPLRWAKAELLHLAWKRGRYSPPDRKLLEHEILPGLAAEEGNNRVLSVGVAWYTSRYAKPFEAKGRTFVTLDVDRAKDNVPQHIVGDVRDLEMLVPDTEPFDVILLNGVIGYGLNTPDDVDRALRACASRLRKGGTLLIGINEEKPTNVDPFSVAAHALFAPRALGRFETGRVMVPVPFRERTHTFLFWRRR